MSLQTLNKLYDIVLETLSISFEELMQTADGRGASSVAKQKKSMCYRHISFFIKSSVSKPDNSLYSTLVQIQKYLLGIFCCLTNGYPSLLILLDLSAA